MGWWTFKINTYIKCGLLCSTFLWSGFWYIMYLFFKLLINDIFVNVTIAYKVTYQFLTRSIVQYSNSSSGACRCRDDWLRWSRFKYSRSTYVSTFVNNFVYRQNELGTYTNTGRNFFEESKSKMFSVLKILLKSQWKSLQKYTQYVKLKPTSER